VEYETDPILDSLLADDEMFAEGKADYQEAYGIGTHPDAKLTEVETFAASDKGFGYRVGLHFNLKGDSMPYKGRVDLPHTIEQNGDADKFEWASKKETAKSEVINRLLAGLGSPKLLKSVIDTDAQYTALVNVLRQLVGNPCPIKVVADGKNVKDATAKNGWRFEPNGFTKLDGIRPRGKK